MARQSFAHKLALESAYLVMLLLKMEGVSPYALFSPKLTVRRNLHTCQSSHTSIIHRLIRLPPIPPLKDSRVIS